eukprot:COSAG05_NODE_354_length_10862_cov_59.954659_4_plen_62_part_00
MRGHEAQAGAAELAAEAQRTTGTANLPAPVPRKLELAQAEASPRPHLPAHTVFNTFHLDAP